MPKTKLRHNGSKDTQETRLVAAQTFQAGDLEHNLTGRFGIFLEINLSFALPSVWGPINLLCGASAVFKDP